MWARRQWKVKMEALYYLKLSCIIMQQMWQTCRPRTFKLFSHSQHSQCTPGIFNLNQKFNGLSCFWGLYIHEAVQNQLRKTSVIRLLKFTIVNMARKGHQHANFSIKNLFFEDYCFGSLMTDVFLDWFWTLLHKWKPQKQESPWNFWSRLKILGTRITLSNSMC